MRVLFLTVFFLGCAVNKSGSDAGKAGEVFANDPTVKKLMAKDWRMLSLEEGLNNINRVNVYLAEINNRPPPSGDIFDLPTQLKAEGDKFVVEYEVTQTSCKVTRTLQVAEVWEALNLPNTWKLDGEEVVSCSANCDLVNCQERRIETSYDISLRGADQTYRNNRLSINFAIDDESRQESIFMIQR